MSVESPDSITEAEITREQDVDRNSLIEQARTFLRSPTVHHESEHAQKAFLLDKGLREQEISNLLQEMSKNRILPPIPPRTYPQPPPSNLPLYLTLLLRMTTWTIGIFGLLTLLYKRYLLPRIIRSFIARHQLILHQHDLITRLKGQIQTLQDEQRTAFRSLQPVIYNTSHIQTLEDIPVDSQGTPSLLVDVILWVFFKNHPDQSFTVAEIIGRLEFVFPNWLQARERKEEFEQIVIQELESSTWYSKVPEHDPTAWSLSQELQSNPPFNPTSSLNKLRNTVKTSYRTKNLYQYAFKSLTDFTAFLSRETFQFYTVDTTTFRRMLGDTNLSPIQDEVRREIRALKGLVLNRRSFVVQPSTNLGT